MYIKFKTLFVCICICIICMSPYHGVKRLKRSAQIFLDSIEIIIGKISSSIEISLTCFFSTLSPDRSFSRGKSHNFSNKNEYVVNKFFISLNLTNQVDCTSSVMVDSDLKAGAYPVRMDIGKPCIH